MCCGSWYASGYWSCAEEILTCRILERVQLHFSHTASRDATCGEKTQYARDAENSITQGVIPKVPFTG